MIDTLLVSDKVKATERDGRLWKETGIVPRWAGAVLSPHRLLKQGKPRRSESALTRMSERTRISRHRRHDGMTRRISRSERGRLAARATRQRVSARLTPPTRCRPFSAGRIIRKAPASPSFGGVNPSG